MEVLYGFKKWEEPKFGIFNQDTNFYKLPVGWIQKEVQAKIIGETDDCFITRLQEGGHGEWVGKKVIQKSYILPLGFHKSRLVRWTSGQLTLFD